MKFEEFDKFLTTALDKLRELTEQTETKENDVDEVLVTQVKKHPNLYNEKNEFYNNKRKRNSSWGIIARALELDVATTKCRWQELVEIFVKEYTDYPPLTGSLMRKKKYETFRLFNKMIWLAPHIPQCITAKSVFIAEENSDATSTSESTEETNPSKENEENLEKYDLSVELFQQNDLSLSASDHYFMMSIMQELQALPIDKKIKFKIDILDLLQNVYTKKK